MTNNRLVPSSASERRNGNRLNGHHRTTQPPPHNADAERALLGSLLLLPEKLDDVTALIQPEDIYVPQYADIYRAILAVNQAGNPVDPVIVAEELRRTAKFNDAGGSDALIEAMEAVPHGAHAAHYARIIAEKSIRRRLILQATDALHAAYDESRPAHHPLLDTDRLTVHLAPVRTEPFAVESLPDPVAGFVRAGSVALGCDPSYIALPLLAALASAVGNTRSVRLKDSWSEPCVLWTAIVGDSGTMKSPAFELALRFLTRRQSEAFRQYGEIREAHEEEMLRHDAALRTWRHKRANNGEPPPTKPLAPVPERLIVSDTTVEALAMILESQPRGVLLARDELSGWLGSFDQYRSGRGGDAASWLSMHRAGPITADRKTGQRIIHVPRAAVSVAGTIQSEILQQALGREHFQDGLAARLLVAMPPRRAKK